MSDENLESRDSRQRQSEQRISVRAILVGHRIMILVILFSIWEIYSRYFVLEPLLFPTFTSVVHAFVENLSDGTLVARTWISLNTLTIGYIVGLVIAFLLATGASMFSVVRELLNTLVAMFNPLPAIALLPLALLWFGFGTAGLTMVIVHSVLWPAALTMHNGFEGVNRTVQLVGRNYELNKLQRIYLILLPSALPSILTASRMGWSFGWRTLIAAELVFGATQEGGGLGWFIFSNKNELEIPNVFAGLLLITLIGLVMEYLVFRTLEEKTHRRWIT